MKSYYSELIFFGVIGVILIQAMIFSEAFSQMGKAVFYFLSLWFYIPGLHPSFTFLLFGFILGLLVGIPFVLIKLNVKREILRKITFIIIGFLIIFSLVKILITPTKNSAFSLTFCDNNHLVSKQEVSVNKKLFVSI